MITENEIELMPISQQDHFLIFHSFLFKNLSAYIYIDYYLSDVHKYFIVSIFLLLVHDSMHIHVYT